MGVVKGPLSPYPHFFMASIVYAEIRSPSAVTEWEWILWYSKSSGILRAEKISKTASVISGPIPSPVIRMTFYF